MSRLEARARQLLRAYPPEYRAERGEEILGTLLDASPPGRDWPTPRDFRSLVTGGLRVRADRNRQYPLGTSLRLALLLAAALGLAANPEYRWLWWVNGVRPPIAIYAACALLVGATVLAPWFAPRSVTITLSLIAAPTLGLLAYYAAYYRLGVALFVVPALAVAAVVANEPARPPRQWLWVPAAAFLATTLLYFVQGVVVSPRLSSVVGITGTVLMVGIGCAVLLWLTVDARPALAIAIFFAGFLGLEGFVTGLQYGWSGRGVAVAGRVLVIPLAVGGLVVARMRSKRPDIQPAGPASDRVKSGG